MNTLGRKAVWPAPVSRSEQNYHPGAPRNINSSFNMTAFVTAFNEQLAQWNCEPITITTCDVPSLKEQLEFIQPQNRNVDH